MGSIQNKFRNWVEKQVNKKYTEDETNVIEENIIEITPYNNTINSAWGEQIIDLQIKPKLNLDKKNVLVFPENVKHVSMEFISDIIKLIPKDIRKKYSFYRIFSIQGNENIKHKFMDVVLLKYR